MLVVLQPDDLPAESQEEKHVLLTVQPRIAAGGLGFVELPAGMVDKGTFGGTAAREIKEELGLDIPEDELTNLTELAIAERMEKGFPGRCFRVRVAVTSIFQSFYTRRRCRETS